MLLVHGTTARHLDGIKQRGLQPRRLKPSVWEPCPSLPDHVYLTNAYACYFAQNAALSEDGSKFDDLLLVEAEVDRKNLWPDEDFLAQAVQDGHWVEAYPDLRDRTIAMRDAMVHLPRPVRLRLADESLARLGTCSHRGPIPVARLRRFARIPAAEVPRLVLQEFDPTITLVNYRVMGQRYREFQASLFERFPL